MNTNTLNLVRNFINSRPCLEACDYIRDWRDSDGRAAYFSDKNRIALQLNDARRLLRFCELYSVDVTAALSNTGDRLFIEGDKLTYHVGQYWPTEYRAAACRKLAAAIWAWWRDECGYDTGDKLRAKARAEFGRGIASRWFN